jgi:hypothetical protein
MQIRRLVVIAGIVLFLAGCATTKAPEQPQTDAEFKQSIEAAEKTYEQQGADPAVTQFEVIAARNPARGQPWSYIAKIRFDEHKYGEAIVAADEALNRDPTDFVAKSVRAVAGLRVAMQSLADLRADSLLAGNARSDAVALAQAMRDTLGQDVLFPEGQKPKRPVRRAPPKPVTPPDSSTAPGAEAPAAGSSGSITQPPSIPGLPGAPSVSVPSTPPVPSAGSAVPTPKSVPTPAVPSPSVPAQSGGNAANAGRAPNPFGNLLK